MVNTWKTVITEVVLGKIVGFFFNLAAFSIIFFFMGIQVSFPELSLFTFTYLIVGTSWWILWRKFIFHYYARRYGYAVPEGIRDNKRRVKRPKKKRKRRSWYEKTKAFEHYKRWNEK